MYSNSRYKNLRSGFFSVKGAVIAEFMLVLPIAAMILTGIIDYGIALKDVQVISIATKEGARFATTYRKFIPAGQLPQNVPDPRCGSRERGTTPCNEATLTCIAFNKTLEYIRKNTVKKDAWRVIAEVINTNPLVDGYSPVTIQVKVERRPSIKNCSLCWYNFVRGYNPESVSNFVVEGFDRMGFDDTVCATTRNRKLLKKCTGQGLVCNIT
jgi:hypothetical protein